MRDDHRRPPLPLYRPLKVFAEALEGVVPLLHPPAGHPPVERAAYEVDVGVVEEAGGQKAYQVGIDLVCVGEDEVGQGAGGGESAHRREGVHGPSLETPRVAIIWGEGERAYPALRKGGRGEGLDELGEVEPDEVHGLEARRLGDGDELARAKAGDKDYGRERGRVGLR